MYRYHAFGLNFSSEIELPECIRATAEPDDFLIRRSELRPPELGPTTIHRRGIMAQTAVEETAVWLHWEGVATYKASSGKLLEVHVESKDPGVLSLFTVSEAIGLILFQRKYFLLHASAVKVGSGGWIFMGAPGAGKSTTCAAFVKAGCQLLSDDLTAITFDNEGIPYVIPAYPQLKIWETAVVGLGYKQTELSPVAEGINKFSLSPHENFDPGLVPLHRIYFIHKDEKLPELKTLSAMELPAETLKHFPMPNQFLTPETLQQYFRQSLQCAVPAKTFAIKRPINFDTLEKWVSLSV